MNRATASPQGSAHLSLIQTLSQPNNKPGLSPAWSLTFTPDAKFMAVCYGCPNTCVQVYRHVDGSTIANASKEDDDTSKEEGTKKNNEEWQHYATISAHSRSIRSVAFAPLASPHLILATASFDGMVSIWECDSSHLDDLDMEDDDEDVTTRFEPIAQLEGHENEVKCVSWNMTGSLLASCGRDKTVWIWECFLPGTVGGGAVMSGGDQPQQDEGDFECLAVLQGHDGDVKSIAFAPSHGQWGEGEEILISASYDNSIKIWAEESGDWYCAATLGSNSTSSIPKSINTNTTSDESSKTLGPVHTSTVWSLAVTPGGARFLSGSVDGSICCWKMYTASERKKLNQDQYVSTDGLWKCVGILPDAHEGYAVLSLDCAPSRAGHGRIVSGGGDDSIRIYRECDGTSDAPKFDLDVVVEGSHLGDVNCVRWHPRDGGCLFSCGDDGIVKVWRYAQS